MTTVRDIDDFMSEWAPAALSEPWDNDGVMLCRDEKAPVTRVLCALEINATVLDEAERISADLILTHHPFIFHAIKRIEGVESDYLARLFGGGISVLSYHTRLDRADGGVNDVLAQKLALSDIRPFGDGMGRVGRLSCPMSRNDFAAHVSQKLGCGIMRTSTVDDNRDIVYAAVLGGGGKDEIPQAAAVADAFVTADLTHNAFITANERGLFVLDAGHYHTENPIVEKIAARLTRAFPKLSVTVCDGKSPFCLL